MKEIIQEELRQLEQTERVRILLAVESGSRAWGFASPDSDYDVRFIYVRPEKDYLRLEKHRDVIELPIRGELDINGWDLSKALRLLHNSNPTLFEWFSSPIVYRTTAPVEPFKAVMRRHFSLKRGLCHYVSMASGIYREHLRSDMVKVKKYFYVLRPILACRWILDKETPPPMRFSALMESELAPALQPEIDRLLTLKMNAPEIKMIPPVNAVNDYLASSIEGIKNVISHLPAEPKKDWTELNEFFLTQIQSF